MKKKEFKSGFTLVEIFVSATVLTIVIAAVLAVFGVGDKIWNQDMNLVVLQQQVRSVNYGMLSEIRQSKSSDITISALGNKITFYVPASSNPIVYELTAAGIIREHPVGVQRNIASDVNSLSFCCRHDDGCDSDCLSSRIVEVQTTANKTTVAGSLSFSLTEKVRLRND